MASSPLDLTIELASELDRHGVPYVLGGSLASSLVGEPRSTVDVDLAIQIDHEQLNRLTEVLRETYYIPTATAANAVTQHGSFNLVHLTEAAKFDLFVLGDGLLDQHQMGRRIWVTIGADPEIGLWVTAPEDQILRKLSWYQLGGGVSDRQWRDVVAILSIQAGNLDNVHLDTTAEQLGIGDLLAQARFDAGQQNQE